MKILDRYILRQFLINFIILSVVMLVLFVLVDMLVELDEFVQRGVTHADQYGNRYVATVVIIIGYYAPLAPLLYAYFSGLLVVGAMGFTLSAMQRNRELTAIVASGVSLLRIAAPILAAGVLLNALVLPIQEFVVPSQANRLSRGKSYLDDNAATRRPVYYAVDGRGNLLSAGDFDVEQGTLTNVSILKRDEQGATLDSISASQAKWNEDQQRWRLVMALQHTPGSVVPLQEDVLRFSTQLSPTVLQARQQAATMRLLSLSSLQSLQRNEAIADQRAQITQVLWSRFSTLVVNVLVLVMAMPMFLVKRPVNPVVQAAIAAAATIGAWGGALVTMQASTAALNPVASAWLPVVLYLPVSVWMLQRVES